MINIDGVSKVYPRDGGRVVALPATNARVDAGEFVCVRGPSGSGKTTLLLMVAGMIRPSTGRIVVDELDVYGLSGRERTRWRARTVGFVFQMFHLFPYASVLENVLTPVLAGAKATRADAVQLLDRFGLADRASHRPSELSTGERQRVAIARALLNRPPLVLADEPTGNLDPASGRVVMDHLADYHREGGTVLLVTHEALASQYAQRTVELPPREEPPESPKGPLSP